MHSKWYLFFCCTYTCGHIFTQIKIGKLKTRAQLTDTEDQISSQIQPNKEKLVIENISYHSKNKINNLKFKIEVRKYTFTCL